MAGIGIDWVRKYNGRAANVINTQAAAEGFYNTLQGVRQYAWGDDLAWDTDFEQRAQGRRRAGRTMTWADNVDIAFYAGHGNRKGPFLGTTIDSGQATPGEVRLGDTTSNGSHFMPARCSNAPASSTGGDRPSRASITCLASIRPVTMSPIAAAISPTTQQWLAGPGCVDRRSPGNRGLRRRGGPTMRADAGGTNTFEDHWHGKGFVSADPDVPTITFISVARAEEGSDEHGSVLLSGNPSAQTVGLFAAARPPKDHLQRTSRAMSPSASGSKGTLSTRGKAHRPGQAFDPRDTSSPAVPFDGVHGRAGASKRNQHGTYPTGTSHRTCHGQITRRSDLAHQAASVQR